MKTLLLLAALGLAGPPATTRAQALSTAPVATLAPAAPDTVAALHRLFAHKRRAQLRIAAATVVAGTGVCVLIGVAAKPYVRGGSGYGSLAPGSSLDFTGLEQVLVGTLTISLVAVESLFYTKYGRKAEQRAAAAQAYGLPAALKRRLRPRYFREASQSTGAE